MTTIEGLRLKGNEGKKGKEGWKVGKVAERVINQTWL